MRNSGCISILLVMLALAWSARADGQAPAAADPIDVQRSQRYVAELTKLEEARLAMRDRAAALVTQTPELQLEFQNWLVTSMVAAGALDRTPPVVSVPRLLQTYRVYRGQSGEIYLNPELLLWYAFQDNTLVRQQLLQSLANSQFGAVQTYAAIQSNRVAIQQLAAESDQSFLGFQHLSDVLGRRSLLEQADAEALTGGMLAADPLNAGAALVRAHALRSLGDFDQSQALLDQLDANLPAVQAARGSVAAQIAYLDGDLDQAKRTLDKAVILARDAAFGEPYLVYGWIQLAEKQWSQAKAHAARLRGLAPDDVETAVLEALAIAYERPNRAREALRVLRGARLNAAQDDWHYHEALAIVHALARDRQFAKREIAAALAAAPRHVRSELEREQQEIEAAQVPAIDWQMRLRLQWRPQ